jgi:formamidopyrimidine-DNA glycosylase
MPELPEVETVRIGLVKLVSGKQITSVSVRWPRIISMPDVEEFKNNLIGESIEDVARRGKFLIFHLTHFDLVSHLRMEGKYDYHENATDELGKHTHVTFNFTDGTQLRYSDVRKFGRMSLVACGQAENLPNLKKLGPEPIEPDFDLGKFTQDLGRHHKAIKPLLLDQTLVVGLGNIYVDESLWQAQIHPQQPADTLTKNEIAILYGAIMDVLKRAIEAGGSTIRTYINALGEAGKFQRELHVYGKTGEPCLRCGAPISKIQLAGRGTHFCPNCQKLRKRKGKRLT